MRDNKPEVVKVMNIIGEATGEKIHKAYKYSLDNSEHISLCLNLK